MIEINLLPGAVRRTRGGRTLSLSGFGLGAAGEWFGNRYVVGGGLAAAVGIAAIAGMYLYGVRRDHTAAVRERVAAADSARFAAVLVARHKAEATRDSVYAQLAIIKSIDDQRFGWPHVLQTINTALPQYTWLTAVRQTSAVTSNAAPASADTSKKTTPASTGAKPPTPNQSGARARLARAHADSLFSGAAGTFTFRMVGQTADIQALTQFMKTLESSPFLKNVQLTRSDLVNADNQQVTEFQLEAETAVPPAHVVQTVPLSIAVH